MTKLETNPNTEARKADHWRKVFSDSCFVIHSSFVIRHSSF